MAEKEKDALTGTETTGHEWDGIKELNTPLPRWWLYTFYVTLIWGLAYTVAYPAWPTLSSYTKGMLGYSSRAELHAEMDGVKASRKSWLDSFEKAGVEDIANDDKLRQYAMRGGEFIFKENCVPCHGAGGQGLKGYPVLADDDWIWGGELEQIYTSIRYGIRSGHDEAKISDMPAFGEDNLSPEQISTVADYVLALKDGKGSDEGKAIYEEEAACNSCHGDDGKGVADLGGPNIVDGIWLYGDGSKKAITAQIAKPRHGVMPAWEGRLDDVSIKMLTVYVKTRGE